MGTPREVGGYIWRQEMNRAIQANRIARRKLARILENDLGRERLALLLAEISQQLGIELEALTELERIGERQARMRRDGSERGEKCNARAGGPWHWQGKS